MSNSDLVVTRIGAWVAGGTLVTWTNHPREDGKLPFAIGDSVAVGFSARALRVLAQ